MTEELAFLIQSLGRYVEKGWLTHEALLAALLDYIKE